MKKKMIVGISFNELKKKNRNNGKDNLVRLTEEWIEYRLSIFRNYTLRSFKAQTNQDFLVLLRYDAKSEESIHKILSKYPKLPDNIKFVRAEEYDHYVTEYISKEKSDYVYFIRMDSDDMYHKTYIQQLYDHKPKKDIPVIINQKGYKFDVNHYRLSIDSRKSPPFYCVIYKTKDYMKGKRYDLTGGLNAVRKMPNEKWNNKNYVYIIHNKNVRGKFFADWLPDEKVIEDDPKKVKKILKKYMR